MSDHGGISTNHTRQRLDQIFLLDATVSMVFGWMILLTPHAAIAYAGAAPYQQTTHEALRLYACLRIAMGWILWNVRQVDDGRFRRNLCESLLACYALQALVVLRAQFTDRHVWINWIAIGFLGSIGSCYAWFRFGQQGNLIKVYELPSAMDRTAR
jgi:cell division protein FtsW (lipid II flippase)